MLSRGSIEILLDLVEIKLAAFIVQDREDPHELVRLERCKRELLVLEQSSTPKKSSRKTALAGV